MSLGEFFLSTNSKDEGPSFKRNRRVLDLNTLISLNDLRDVTQCWCCVHPFPVRNCYFLIHSVTIRCKTNNNDTKRGCWVHLFLLFSEIRFTLVVCDEIECCIVV